MQPNSRCPGAVRQDAAASRPVRSGRAFSHGAGAPVLGVLLALLLVGCAGAPPRSAPGGSTGTGEVVPGLGERIVQGAIAQLGKPYRYGGSGPEAFDCSGLVHFVHAALGITVPRTTAEQFRQAQPVSPSQLAEGDLLFFRMEGQEVSHVGIYAGDGRFVHAPQTGRPVEARALADPFYSARLLGSGRFHSAR